MLQTTDLSNQSKDKWDCNFPHLSPVFSPIGNAMQNLNKNPHQWPDLRDYQSLLDQLQKHLSSKSAARLKFVPQAPKAKFWQDDYEPRIYLKGEIQTRTENWHDFFQVLVWCTFPKSKTVLNARHYAAIKNRIETNPHKNNRTPLENALTQYDECGAIIVSSDNSLLNLVKGFKWKELFWERRKEVTQYLRCFVFGHAVYEKVLNPYIGLTAHATLFKVKSGWFEQPLLEQLQSIDQRVANEFTSGHYTTPKDFSPFPLLGMPGWYRGNDLEKFYDNIDYFRPGRSSVGECHS